MENRLYRQYLGKRLKNRKRQKQYRRKFQQVMAAKAQPEIRDLKLKLYRKVTVVKIQ